jgi:predicted RNase H-like nuclease (RuvC/YqgF family)
MPYLTILKYGLPVFAVFGILFYVYHVGYSSGSAEVAVIREQMAENSAKFEADARAAEQRQQAIVDQTRKQYNDEVNKQNQTVAKLNAAVSSLRKQSSGYVAQIERLSKTTSAPCDAALELANKQYGELAALAATASGRADSASAIANSLSNYVSDISGTTR